MDPQVSDAKLSNYRVDRLLGAGGMGAVYLARDLTLQLDVALKFIVPAFAHDESARRRLIREARAAAALDHPNICSVHDVVVTSDGQACIVMQYVEGETLAETVKRGPLEVRRALAVTADLASGLAAAHKRGIVHRDLKPGNVMLTTSGRVVLLDFGIARTPTPTTRNRPRSHPRTLHPQPGVIYRVFLGIRRTPRPALVLPGASCEQKPSDAPRTGCWTTTSCSSSSLTGWRKTRPSGPGPAGTEPSSTSRWTMAT